MAGYAKSGSYGGGIGKAGANYGAVGGITPYSGKQAGGMMPYGAGRGNAMPYGHNGMIGNNLALIVGNSNASYMIVMYSTGMTDIYTSDGMGIRIMPNGGMKSGNSIDNLVDKYSPGAGSPGALPYNPRIAEYNPMKLKTSSYGDISDRLSESYHSGAAPYEGKRASDNSNNGVSGSVPKPVELMKRAPAERYDEMSRKAATSDIRSAASF